MRKTLFLGSLLIAALMLSALACGGGTASPTATSTKAATQPTPTKAAGGAPTGEVINIKLTENPYRFVPDTFNLELGKTYTLVFEKPKAYHTFTVRDLPGADGKPVDIQIPAGETVQQTISPAKAGTFKLICIPHEMLGQVGQVIVK